MTQIIESKCGNCGAPLTGEKCDYCAHVLIVDGIESRGRGKKHRYYISFGNEGFNAYSDLPLDKFMLKLLTKEWVVIDDTVAGNIRFDKGAILHIPMIKFVKEYSND